MPQRNATGGEAGSERRQQRTWRQSPGARAFEVFLKCFEKGVLIRVTGDIVALSPPLIIESKQISQIVETLAEAIRETA